MPNCSCSCSKTRPSLLPWPLSLIIGYPPACPKMNYLTHVQYARLLPIVMALPNGFPANPRSVVIFLLPTDGWLPIYHAWHLIFLGYFFIDFPSDISIFLAYFFMDNSSQLPWNPPGWPHCIMYCMWYKIQDNALQCVKGTHEMVHMRGSNVHCCPISNRDVGTLRQKTIVKLLIERID